MAGINGLKEKLMDDSKQKAEEIKNKADFAAKEIVDKAQNEAAKILDDSKAKAEAEGKSRKERIISRAKLDARNLLLKVKQDEIDNVLKLALDKIDNMGKEEYEKIIEKLLLNNIETGDEEVIISLHDKSRISSDLIKRVNQVLEKDGKTGKLTLSSEMRDIGSGFILKRSGVEINCSAASLIDVLRENIELDLSNLLFN
jgi:V/A-type H+-transporting ATPase subunit E